MYDIIRECFRAHFNDPKKSKLDSFVNNPRPLDTSLIKDEVVKSIHKLQNNRTTSVPPETIKYAPHQLHDLKTVFLNNIFTKHNYMNVGPGFLDALKKPSKPQEPTKSFHPLIFLIMLWKFISNTVISRIQPTVEEYLSHFQNADVELVLF